MPHEEAHFPNRMPGTWIASLVSEDNRHARTMDRVHPDLSDKERLDKEYTLLNILDSKAANLLGIDALILTITAIFFTFGGETSGNIFLILILFGVSISMIASSFVISVDWRFCSFVTFDENEKPNFSNEIRYISRVIVCRTVLYQFSWFLTFLALVIMLIFLFVRFVVC